jgi:hypothetical protein
MLQFPKNTSKAESAILLSDAPEALTSTSTELSEDTLFSFT